MIMSSGTVRRVILAFGLCVFLASGIFSARCLAEGGPLSHCEKGMQLLREGRYADAAKEFAEEMKINPGSAEAHCRYAYSLIREAGRAGTEVPRGAFDALEQALALDPGFGETYFLLAAYRYGKGTDEESLRRAVAYYDRFIALAADAGEHSAGRIRFARTMKKSLEAVLEESTALMEALRKNPRDGGALVALGNVFYGRGALEQAESLYIRALEVSAERADAHLGMARVRFGGYLALKLDSADLQDGLDAAAACGAMAQEALKRDAVFAERHRRLLDEVVRECESALALDPGLGEAHLLIALVCDERGEEGAALERYRAFLAACAGANANDVEYARRRVGELHEAKEGGR